MNTITENYLSYLNLMNLSETQMKEHYEEIITESGINVATAERSYKKNIKAAEQYLKKYNINISKIKATGKKASKFIIDQKKKGIPADKASKALVNKYGKIVVSDIRKSIKNYGYDLDEKVIISLGIFAILVFASTVLAQLSVIFIMPVLGLQAVNFTIAIIIAPFLEEAAKRYALLKDFPFLYTGIFAGLEFIKYMNIILMTGEIGILAGLALRGAAVALHFFTTIIQKYFHDESKEHDLPYVSVLGYFLAVATHMVYNMLMIYVIN